MQVWGAELWEAAQLAQVPRWALALLEALRPAEQDLLLAAAGCPSPPLRTEDLKASLDKNGAHVNVSMGRLVEEGMLFRARRGEFLYAAPKFHAYLARRAAGQRYKA